MPKSDKANHPTAPPAPADAPAAPTPKPPKPTRMNDAQVQAALVKRPEWSKSGDAIQRTYAFKDFAASMKFVDAVAREAEKADHHPDILIRWNKVTLTLSTHDAGGISKKDFDLAAVCDAVG